MSPTQYLLNVILDINLSKSFIYLLSLFLVSLCYTHISLQIQSSQLHACFTPSEQNENQLYQYRLAERDISANTISNKLILFYNFEYFKSKCSSDAELNDWLSKEDTMSSCPAKNCIFSMDRSMVNRSDAVIFDILRLLWRGTKPPKRRNCEQRWIFYSRESSCRMWKLAKSWQGVFNWTMTFKLDSDIPTKWKVLKRKDVPSERTDYVSIVKRKTKKVACLVSNCHDSALRDLYVSELSKHIDVDIYAKCGKFECGSTTNCISLFDRKYKFYLSFENSLQEDYVTEKFWRTLNMNLVTIVRSGANYTRHGVLPSWIINTKDFEHPKDLARYLDHLDKNISEYMKYLSWKREHFSQDCMEQHLCTLCVRLNNPFEPVKWYSGNAAEKWFSASRCKATDLGFIGSERDLETKLKMTRMHYPRRAKTIILSGRSYRKRCYSLDVY